MPDLHELLEDRLQLSVGDLAAVDVQRLEVPAVHEVAQPGIGAPVGLLRVGRQLDRHLDALGDLAEVGFEPLPQLLDRDALAPQPALLVVEQVGADAVGVERVEQLALLGFDACERPLGVTEVLVADLRQLLQAGHQLVAQHLALPLGQRHPPVEPLDGRLDVLEPVVRLVARAVLFADAEEVLVLDPHLSPVAAVEQPRSAVAAEERPGEVVVVVSRAGFRGGRVWWFPLFIL